MISINEQKEYFAIINQKLQQQIGELYQALLDNQVGYQEHKLHDASPASIWSDNVHFIKGGNVSVEQDDKTLYILEYGDLIQGASLNDLEQTNIAYEVKSEATIHTFDKEAFMQAIANSAKMLNLWFTISSLIHIQFNQIVGGLTRKEEVANPGFGRFSAGASIITEGEEADYVYSVVEGTAVAVHKGVEVGEIGQDEIFGAIAVLTNQKRTANVIAKTNCTLLMVHKDQFSKLVHSHPKLFLNILSSLADKIISLNEKVSSLV